MGTEQGTMPIQMMMEMELQTWMMTSHWIQHEDTDTDGDGTGDNADDDDDNDGTPDNWR